MDQTGQWKTKGRNYPFSVHDNRVALKDTIDTFDQGLGRRKCLDEQRQHSSHFCLCHDDSMNSLGQKAQDFSVYQTDYPPHQETRGSQKRRFPRDHLEKSGAATVDHSGDVFMWFGRHDSDDRLPLHVLAATNHSLPSQSNHSRHSKN
ncbi:testis-expressed protein 36 [Chanos chanos]|uniref:Testis-expressed protein 36 n=1 Tax=Chanos chanos TaxID=29144 RepID=A0A6J2WFM1_CHACN|nr:testis-expressed protein 36 [Chanos chanos]